nr:MAG TPA: hypothetical protein [Caudoviricetes sp.]
MRSIVQKATAPRIVETAQARPGRKGAARTAKESPAAGRYHRGRQVFAARRGAGRECALRFARHRYQPRFFFRQQSKKT